MTNKASTLIHTPTPNVIESIQFYHKLGFKTLSESTALVTDGRAVIEINPDRFARPGLKIFRSSWSQEIELLAKQTAITKSGNGYIASDPSGVWVYLVEGSSKVDYGLEEASFGIPGNFADLSLETTDINRILAKHWFSRGA